MPDEIDTTAALERDGSNEASSLLAAIERVRSLHEEKADIDERIKDEYAQIKATGFDTKIVRKVIARQKRKPEEVEEEDALIATYEHALERAKGTRGGF